MQQRAGGGEKVDVAAEVRSREGVVGDAGTAAEFCAILMEQGVGIAGVGAGDGPGDGGGGGTLRAVESFRGGEVKVEVWEPGELFEALFGFIGGLVFQRLGIYPGELGIVRGSPQRKREKESLR